ncbi:MAG: TIGR04282 family arsenosugar biosynthesis glycosyltransferase [Deltaproteobacteria bacterium]|nr:TIGR04282 family arsenosugar biosynthesis glycosyltransferase [Deltaproteobacteria bacterium]
MPLGILYVFAKEPEPGRVKTRLCPPLTSQQAADLAEAFLVDMLAALAAGSEGLFESRLAVSPGRGGPRLSALAATFGLARIEQGEGDLGRRMCRVMEAGLDEAPMVALVGADVPDLPVAHVRAAFEALAAGRGAAAPQVVLGPSSDGGYYLVAARRRVPRLFRIHARWGGSGVLAATTAALDDERIAYALLPQWSDVDDAASLASLWQRIGSDPSTRCVRSADALARLRRQGWRP